MLGLKPWEFYEMTVYEFNQLLEGYNWNQERHSREQAWALANIINSCRQPVKGHRSSLTVDKLSPRRWIAPKNPFYRALLGIRGGK